MSNFFIAVIAFLHLSIIHAGKPVWTFTPDVNNPPTQAITSDGSAVIKYTIMNQSRKTHILSMKPIAGISQITSAGNCPKKFKLAPRQSCTLNLFVHGELLQNNIKGGPDVCEQGNVLECYQPALANNLNITLIPLTKYLLTSTAGLHGTIKPHIPQIVLAGSSFTFIATPNSDYQVDEWRVDEGIAQKGGITFTLSNINSNHTIEVTFTHAGTLYGGTANGSIHFSTDNGLTWAPTAVPSPGNAVNSIFATQNTLYVGSADGRVYYSFNNGSSWNISSPPGTSSVNSVFVTTASIIYVGTQEGKVYFSSDNGLNWFPTISNPGTAPINSIFITPSAVIYVGSNDGNIYYSSNNGNSWNVISGPESSVSVPIQNIFAVNGQLYVNTRQTSSNDTLPPGTINFEYAYFANSLTDPNPVWTILSQITYTLFVNADASIMHAGTQNGHVFSLTTGDDLGYITSSPISSLFFFG